MNGIIGMTELALDTELTPLQHDYLNTVKVSADNLLTIINDILDFSKIEAGRSDLERTVFSLRNTVGQTLKTLASRAFLKGLDLTYDLAADIPDKLWGDSGKLRQVLLNLLGNAVKFTERGQVDLAVTSDRRDDRQVLLHFRVTDTGIGIPSAMKEFIFSPFTQADGSTTRQYGGTGLGLAIARQMVTLMGGELWVDSTEGQGSAFHFTLPMEIPADDPPVPTALTDALRGKSALIVDDNAINRSLLKHLLQEWPMPIREADGANAALACLAAARARDERFDLMLIDAQMPDMNGWDLVAQIRADAAHDGCQVIMMPDAGSNEVAERCQNLGIAGYLVKPVIQEELEKNLTCLFCGDTGTTPVPDPPAIPQPQSSLTILLVEDGAINQQFAARSLEKHGHRVVVANNGRQGVELWERETVDIVLMDVQMPEMDGFQATAAIRAMERASGRHTPIMAITAYAMKGDGEKCRAAGMDGYVTKPFKAPELLEAIGNLTGKPQAPRQQTANPPAPPPPAPPNDSPPDVPLDWAALLETWENDREFAVDLLRSCIEPLATQRAALARAVVAADPPTLDAAAHLLRGSLLAIHAKPSCELTQTLETMGRKQDMAQVSEIWRQLDLQLTRLIAEINRIVVP